MLCSRSVFLLSAVWSELWHCFLFACTFYLRTPIIMTILLYADGYGGVDAGFIAGRIINDDWRRRLLGSRVGTKLLLDSLNLLSMGFTLTSGVVSSPQRLWLLGPWGASQWPFWHTNQPPSHSAPIGRHVGNRGGSWGVVLSLSFSFVSAEFAFLGFFSLSPVLIDWAVVNSGTVGSISAAFLAL